MQLIKAISENPQESRREWLLWMFKRAGNKNSQNSVYQFWQQHNQPIELEEEWDRTEDRLYTQQSGGNLLGK